MDMDVIFHIHGNPANSSTEGTPVWFKGNVASSTSRQEWSDDAMVGGRATKETKHCCVVACDGQTSLLTYLYSLLDER